jgi:hypothetical protein
MRDFSPQLACAVEFVWRLSRRSGGCAFATRAKVGVAFRPVWIVVGPLGRVHAVGLSCRVRGGWLTAGAV